MNIAPLIPAGGARFSPILMSVGKPKPRFGFKKFQLEDYARIALHHGAILGHDTGGGKGLALFVLAALKCGFDKSVNYLSPLKPCLLVAPGDLHNQLMEDGQLHFRARVTPIDSQAKFLELSTPNPHTGKRELPPGYYITSYTQLAGNGVIPFPKYDPENWSGMMQQLGLNEEAAIEFFSQRGVTYKRIYDRLRSKPEDSAAQLHSNWLMARKDLEGKTRSELDDDYHLLANFATPQFGGEFNDLADAQQEYVLKAMTGVRYRQYAGSIGNSRWYKDQDGAPFKVKCVYSPSLADLSQESFTYVGVDEGVKIKGEDTDVGLGVRQMNPPFRFVLSATPIKNRLPDVFRLAWWAAGAHSEAHARFPYPDATEAREEFTTEFMITERNLTKEENSETSRRFVKFTPQVCNIHRVWKLFAPLILRRRKKDFGEDIVTKTRHVVRVPMGKAQAAAYRFHLDAQYLDKNGRPAIGAQLQALRIAAANPCSLMLERPYGDGKTKGEPRSNISHTPKLHAALKLITQILQRGEQVVIFSAFNDSLDGLAAKLTEAGVKHCLLDGRTSPKKRAQLAKEFKVGPPKANGPRASAYPVMLAGIECMAEGHSFNLCNNVILMCYSWAYDKFEQAINRVHRLNSLWDVNVYPIICDGSIDRKLEALQQEKGDAAELVLDGKLLGENSAEVNLAELLHIARQEFDGKSVVDEKDLEKEWPQIRLQLGRSQLNWPKTAWQPQPQAVAPAPAPSLAPVKAYVAPPAPVKKVVSAKPQAFTDMPLWTQSKLPPRPRPFARVQVAG